MATVKFYLDKERKNGSLILVTFTFNHERLRFSTGLNVPKKAWDDKDQKAKPLKEFAETNKHLRDVNSFLLNIYDELFAKGVKISKEDVKKKSLEIKEAYQVFAGRKDAAISYKTSLAEFIPIFQARYKNKHSTNHIQHFNGIKTHLETFQKETGTIVTFDSINKDFYISFTDYLKAANLKPNTIGSHIKRIKRLMNEANEDKLTANQEHRATGFKVLKEDSDTIYLTEDDISALYELKIEESRMRKIR